MRPVFVQFRCTPGKTYEVADAIYDREIVSELYSTSGEYDLMAKVYIPEDQDVGRFLVQANGEVADARGQQVQPPGQQQPRAGFTQAARADAMPGRCR